MITKQTVINMLESHGYKFEDLAKDLGNRVSYSKNKVLAWMGY